MSKKLMRKGAASFEGDVVALKGVLHGRVSWYNQGTQVYPVAGVVLATGAVLPRELIITSKVMIGEGGTLTEVPVSPDGETGYVRGNLAVSAKCLKEALGVAAGFDPSKGPNLQVPVLVNPTPEPVTSKNGQVYKTWTLLQVEGQRAFDLSKSRAVPGRSTVESNNMAAARAAITAFWGENAPQKASFPTIQVAEWNTSKRSGQEALDQADDE